MIPIIFVVAVKNYEYRFLYLHWDGSVTISSCLWMALVRQKVGDIGEHIRSVLSNLPKFYLNYLIWSIVQLRKLREAERVRKLSKVTEQIHSGHSSNPGTIRGKIHTTLPLGMFWYLLFLIWENRCGFCDKLVSPRCFPLIEIPSLYTCPRFQPFIPRCCFQVTKIGKNLNKGLGPQCNTSPTVFFPLYSFLNAH